MTQAARRRHGSTARGAVVCIPFAKAEALGATALDLQQEDVVEKLQTLTNGGVDVAFEVTGGSCCAEDMVTQRISLADIVEEGFEALLSDKAQVKIIVTP